MRIGGRCPLNCNGNQKEFLIRELEDFHKKQIDGSNIETMKKEFCRSVCKNIMC